MEERDTTDYTPAEKVAAGDRFAGLFSRESSKGPASKPKLKKPIVDDINL